MGIQLRVKVLLITGLVQALVAQHLLNGCEQMLIQVVHIILLDILRVHIMMVLVVRKLGVRLFAQKLGSLCTILGTQLINVNFGMERWYQMEQILFVDLIQVLVRLHGHSSKIGAQQFLLTLHYLILVDMFIQAHMLGQINPEKVFHVLFQIAEIIVL